MLIRVSRITADGLYRSPNVCFADGDEGPEHEVVEAEADGEDEGSGEPEGDEQVVDGGEDDEGGQEDLGGSEEGSEEGAPRGVETSRGRTFRDEKKERKAAQLRAEAAERKAEEIQRRADAAERRADEAERRAEARGRQENEAAEAARVELMSDGERFAHFRQKDRQESDARLAGIQAQIWNSNDVAKFERLVDRDPLVAKVREKVEAEFEKLLAVGRQVPREVLANIKVGEMVRANAAAAKTKQRTRGQESIRRETTKPVRSRGAAPAERQRRGAEEDTREARKKRLLDVSF